MANSIAFTQNYTTIIDEVYQRAGVSNVLNPGRRMVRAGHNAKKIMISKISVMGLGDYTRNVGYKTGGITYEFETKTFNYDCGIRLFADVMDVEEAGVLDCFVEAGAGLQRTQVSTGSRILFITPTLKGVLDDYSYANPTMSNRVLERFARVVEVPQVRFYTAVDAFAEFSEGQVSGFALGDFKVMHYEGEGTTGEEIATPGALKELVGASFAFCGVR